ncbi:MAG: DUF3298 and DUF4163 domain-containing protein [Ignavibacteria bacterium]|nr:DUF3298 and DUF4163 domain-containing protein [Ignavibacteria bacterium]
MLLIFFAGCGKKEGKITDTVTDTAKITAVTNAGETAGTKGTDSLSYEIRKYLKTYKDCSDTAFGCTYLKAEYPVFTAGAYKDKINSVIQSYMTDSVFITDEPKSNKSFDGLAEVLFADYKRLKADFADFDMGFVLEFNSSVIYNNSGILTVAAGNYANTGGAHPNSYLKYFVFDVKTGKVLKTADIFEPGFEKKLNGMIEKKFREQFELPEDKPLTEILFENKIEFNNNFAITKEGIEFLYNRYEIMAYVYGEAEIKFAYDELKDILKKQFMPE